MALFNYKGFFTKERKKSLIIGVLIFVLALVFHIFLFFYSSV